VCLGVSLVFERGAGDCRAGWDDEENGAPSGAVKNENGGKFESIGLDWLLTRLWRPLSGFEKARASGLRPGGEGDDTTAGLALSRHRSSPG